jgi:hypothetical protein
LNTFFSDPTVNKRAIKEERKEKSFLALLALWQERKDARKKETPVVFMLQRCFREKKNELSVLPQGKLKRE